MGYVRNVVYKLDFEDDGTGQFEGLEVRARSAPISELLELGQLAEMSQEQLNANGMAAMRRLVAGFGKALVSWNVETMADPDDEASDRVPVPATEEGLMQSDFDFVIAIILAWMQTIAGAAGPLVKRAPGGGTSVAGLIPMEPLSPSQAS